MTCAPLGPAVSTCPVVPGDNALSKIVKVLNELFTIKPVDILTIPVLVFTISPPLKVLVQNVSFCGGYGSPLIVLTSVIVLHCRNVLICTDPVLSFTILPLLEVLDQNTSSPGA